MNQTLIGRIRRLLAEGHYRDWIATLLMLFQQFGVLFIGLYRRLLKKYGKVVQTCGIGARTLMQQARQQANNRLHLHKHQYSRGDQVWLWNLERMQPLNRKFNPFWTVPWRICSRNSRSLRTVEHESTRRYCVAHSDHLQAYYWYLWSERREACGLFISLNTKWTHYTIGYKHRIVVIVILTFSLFQQLSLIWEWFA